MTTDRQKMRHRIYREIPGWDAGSKSVGSCLTKDDINRILKVVAPEHAVEPHEVYKQGGPYRRDMRLALADAVGLDDYDAPPGSQGRNFNLPELAQILEALRDGQRDS